MFFLLLANMVYEPYYFAVTTNNCLNQIKLINTLTDVLTKHLEQKDKVSSLENSTTIGIFSDERGVNATYIQSNLAGNHMQKMGDGEVKNCSAILYLFGNPDSPVLNDIRKDLNALKNQYPI